MSRTSTNGTSGTVLGGQAPIRLCKNGSYQQLGDNPNNDDDRNLRSRLLWMYPDAATIDIGSSLAWEGTIVAPNADVAIHGSIPIRGSIIANSISGSATMRHYPLHPQLLLP